MEMVGAVEGEAEPERVRLRSADTAECGSGSRRLVVVRQLLLCIRMKKTFSKTIIVPKYENDELINVI